MSANRVLVAVAVGLLVTVLGWTALVGAALAWSGMARVRVAGEGGPDVTVPLPMAGLEAASLVFDVASDFENELALEAWAPLVDEILAALDECPDAVIVEVEDDGAHVRVEKRGRSLVVKVVDGATDVEVTVPTRSARRTLTRLLG